MNENTTANSPVAPGREITWEHIARQLKAEGLALHTITDRLQADERFQNEIIDLDDVIEAVCGKAQEW